MQKKEFLVLMWAVSFSITLLSCKKKSDEAPAPVVPSIKIEDASQARTTTGSVMHFTLTLNKTTTVPVSVDYTLTDGTAKAPADYTAASGTVTIPANQALGQIEVQIKGDATNTRQNNLEFTVNLSNAKACTLGTSSAKGTIITEDGTNLATDNTGYSTPLSYPGYTLVWNDEFDGTTIDLNNWNQEIGNGQNGWGNNELEYYTNSTKNTFVSNGNLIIEARKEAVSGFNYTSGRMTTQNKKAFTFGRIDIRAKLPVSKGLWPALWMLGSNINTVSWPACGEIDIMELIGTYPNRCYGTMHWKPVSGINTNKGSEYNLPSGDFSQQFHVFSIIWTQDTIKWLVDDHLFLTTTKADVGAANYPFNADQFLIFNVAVGGNWPGSPDAGTAFPQRMFVDYVRVFQ
ncbi:MAG: family 16 glycosylhydrolase [Flavisolibacter sp.]